MAADEARARAFANSYVEPPYGEKPECQIQEHEHPDAVYTVGDDAPESVVIFPDAGCC